MTLSSGPYPALKHWVRRHLLRQHPVRVAPLAQLFDSVEVLYQHSDQAIDAPLLDTMPLAPVVSNLRGPTYTPPDTMVAQVENGLFCPTNRVLLGPDRTIVAESLCTMSGDQLPEQPHYPFKNEALFVNEVEPLPGLSTTIQFYRRNYYHMLADALPRLHLLHQMDLSVFDEPVQLLCTDLSPMERWYLDLLRPAGTVVVPVEPGRLYQPERFLHLSFLTCEFASYVPPPYLHFFRDRVLPERPSRANRRVLVSRQKTGTRRMRNFDAVWDLLAPMGFERYDLETLSPAEQRELFYDAEWVVATHGAGLTNLLFAGPQTRVVELFPHPYAFPCYYLMGRPLGLDYQYLCGSEQDRYADHDVDLEALRACLERAPTSTPTDTPPLVPSS